jgi:methylmalonyl-CoA/ethylmalonyl-CoA epimerase
MLTFDHVGYVVADIESCWRDFFRPLFGAGPVTEPVDDPLQQVRVAFLDIPPGFRIELVQPLSEKSPVRRLLDSGRGGVYHICYAVEDIEGQIARFREQGCVKISGPTPAVAFDNRRVAFLFTPQRDIVELVERQ